MFQMMLHIMARSKAKPFPAMSRPGNYARGAGVPRRRCAPAAFGNDAAQGPEHFGEVNYIAPMKTSDSLERGGPAMQATAIMLFRSPPLCARQAFLVRKRRQAAALQIDGAHSSLFRQEGNSIAVRENETDAAVTDRRYMSNI
jgi:hypothetical protein